MGEEIIIQDENGKKYSVLTVLDADTKKIIDDLSALVVKKDKIIDLMAENIIKYETELGYEGNYKNKKEVIKYFEKESKNAKD